MAQHSLFTMVDNALLLKTEQCPAYISCKHTVGISHSTEYDCDIIYGTESTMCYTLIDYETSGPIHLENIAEHSGTLSQI